MSHNTLHEPVVAIDGPAGTGKSTVAQLAAERTGLQFISSGSMYRAVALIASRVGVSFTDRIRLTELAGQLQFRFSTDADGTLRTEVNGEDITTAIRQPEIGEAASALAVIPELRAILVAKQQAYGKYGGIVMEGRDIQTVVFPNAEIKVFLTASAEERAHRRWRELTAKGEQVSLQDVLAEVCARDAQDLNREASPLRAAPDAICVNTDNKSIDEVVDVLVRLITYWREEPTLHGRELARLAGLNEED